MAGGFSSPAPVRTYQSIPTSSSPTKPAAVEAVRSPLVGPSAPQERASLVSKLFFAWASPLLHDGSQRRLDPDDMWGLESENQCSALGAAFAESFDKTQSILRSLVATQWPTLLVVACFQALVIVLSYVGPMALQQILQAIEGSDSRMDAVATAISMLFFSKVLSAFVTVHGDILMQRTVIRTTSALQSLLFHKTLRLDAAVRRTKGAGDIANLFSSDMQWITAFSTNVNLVWTSPVRVVITLGMLYNVIGYAAFVGSGVLVLAFVVNYMLTRVQRRVLMAYTTEKDARMKAVNEIFGAMKTVKLHAWEVRMEAKVTALRAAELHTLRAYVVVEAVQTALLFTAPVVVTLASFFTYTIVMEKTLSVSKIFTAMSLFALLKYPMMGLPQAIVGLMQALVATERMESFLHLADQPAASPSPPPLTSAVAIAVDHATFGWHQDTPLFHDVNLRILKGEFVVVHGGVSAGKSSLCSALLGEMITLQGAVSIAGSVAYVPQQPWIQHMTIRENILFGLPYDRMKYNKVVEACALTRDFATFPAGDRTEIGQRGVNLSGGQQARVSLARACYSSADVFVLDAPLAAVDAIVAREILDKCFRDLLADKTIVLVTHNVDVIDAVDVNRSLLVLPDGQLIDRVVSPRQHVADAPNQPEKEPPMAIRRRSSAAMQAQPMDLVDDRSSSLEPLKSPVPVPAGAALFTPVGASLDQQPLLYDEKDASHDGKLTVEETRSEGRVATSVFVEYARASGGWPIWTAMSLLLVLGASVQVSSDLWLSTWSSTAADVTPAEFLRQSGSYLSVYSILVLAGCVVQVARAVVTWSAGLRASRALFAGMTRALFRAPMAFFDVNPVGRILNRYGNDMTAIDTRIPTISSGLMALTVSSAFTLGTTILAMNAMAFLLLPLLYYYYRIASFYLHSARAIERVNTITKSPLLNLSAEMIDGAHVVRAFGPTHVTRLHRQHQANVDRNNQAFFAAQVANQWFALRTQLFSACMLLAIAVALVASRHVLSAGVIGLVLNYSFGILPLFELVIFLWSLLETQMVAPERVAEYTYVAPEAPRVLQGAVPQSWPSAGALVLDDVSFRYKPTDPLVLQHVSVRIAAGEKIGLVGRTGAGKSSLTMALFRLNELASGTICIDGVDIATVGVHTLRSRLAIIPQSPVLFHGTVRAYLDPLARLADDSLWACLRKVQLADRFANAPARLETLVDENGANFSVGERQILCMARALLSEAKVVVLDEATAATDAATDAHLQQVIRTEFAAATVLIIAHRLDSILDCDRVMVFDHGRLTQCDSPDALLAAGTGAFYDFVHESNAAK
ncbi:Aste57867_14592 [Aphanomyces stellatus]|uniref:Aste57867_14592 protein n=1 Tax=Aphanomyces stellatus TaxID=120398 RepID=A0A485L2R7_9STRA|nr:hypothetical protein As57867_014538 [Aphanomyces stellatus]VFT91411.1 Aste57867_14592 [Aphanomyces stellatus]